MPDKLKIHPADFSQPLLNLLKDETKWYWEEIKTRKLYILSWDSYKNKNIEISFNNITGLVNCEYVRTLSEIDSRFHKVGYYLKHFVEKSKIFNKINKLNSFSLIWMLIV